MRQIVLVGFLQAQNCTNLVSSWRHPASRTDFTSPAFYQRIGGIQTDNGYNDIGGIRYPEVAFDWPDLRRWKEDR